MAESTPQAAASLSLAPPPSSSPPPPPSSGTAGAPNVSAKEDNAKSLSPRVTTTFGLFRKRVLDALNWLGPASRSSSRMHVVRGFIKSFLLYLVPITALSRKLELGNVRRAAAIGFFVSGVRAMDHVLSALKKARELTREQQPLTDIEQFVHKYTLAVSTFASCLVALIIDGELHKSSAFVIWAVIRAIRCLLPTTGPAIPTAIMSASAGLILSTWMFARDECNPTYIAFLDKHGGQTKETMMAIGAGRVSCCELLHPGMGCTQHFFHFFLHSLPRSIKVYLPVFLMSFIFSSKRNVLFTLENIARSATFLSLYCSLAWTSACVSFNFFKPKDMFHSRLTLLLHTWVAGLALLVERRGRQVELAAYCATYAADIVFRFLVKRGYVSLMPSLNLFLCSLAAATVIHHRDQQPQLVINFLFKLSEIPMIH